MAACIFHALAKKSSSTTSLHMKHAEDPLTSEALGEMPGTNAVVVRRLFGGLRDMGYVASEKGYGGGWVLDKPLENITLLDVYRAIGEPPLFSDLVSHDHPACLVANKR